MNTENKTLRRRRSSCADESSVPALSLKVLRFAVALIFSVQLNLVADTPNVSVGDSGTSKETSVGLAAKTGEDIKMNIPVLSFEHELRLKVGGEYHLRLPDDYEADSRRWPLLIYLHGMGGQDEILSSNGPHNLMAGDADDIILCMPKCAETRWQADVILGLIQKLISEHRIDMSRIYLTGISIGGLATWELALRRPALFAAIVPLCGAGQPWNAYKIARVPCWAFHGRHDQIVPVSETEVMVEALKEDGGGPKLTILESSGHDISYEVYRKQELWQWVFAQRNPEPDLGMIAGMTSEHERNTK